MEYPTDTPARLRILALRVERDWASGVQSATPECRTVLTDQAEWVRQSWPHTDEDSEAFLMTRHPEQFDRGSNGQPYDPDEPLLVRWADVVAARNAAHALLVVLNDADVDLESTTRAVGWQVRDWLPTAVGQGPHEELGSREEAVAWLEDLVQRLWTCLP